MSMISHRVAEGAVTPLRTITGFNSPEGVALDPNINELFVTDRDADSLTVLGRDADGAAAPLPTITGWSNPQGVASGSQRDLKTHRVL